MPVKMTCERRFNITLDTVGFFGDKPFQAIDCTGTDNRKLVIAHGSPTNRPALIQERQ